RAYAQSYKPFLQLLLRHPAIRLGLHYSGCLLEWIEEAHPEFFELLGLLVRRGQVELVGGGFYEPILISIPLGDRLEQIRRMSDYLEQHFGHRPEGAWLAERVWEPQLPSTLALAGIRYSLVDDVHFLAAGFELSELHGSYVAEDLGSCVKLIPGLKKLRYLVPFATVEENISFLRAYAAEHPGGLAAMGDDCEKFGVWPGTWKHSYQDGWLERYFTALEENSDWLVTATPGEYLAAHAPLGRADLPTASYSEMMEWALPTSTRQRFHQLQQEFSNRPDVASFLRGSCWRSFFSKYSEVNLLHKKMLHVSGKIRRLAASTRRGLPLHRALDDATTYLLRGQCNDAYWHGVFGGLYAPHLRTAVCRDLIRAEKIADAAEQARTGYAELSRLDFDADGCEDLYLVTETFAALFRPVDGATMPLIDYRPSDVTLINSVQRRPEAYHARLREAASGGAHAVASIHEQLKVKEPGLEKRLRYDLWARHAFRLLLFPPWKTPADYESLALEASADFAAGAYTVDSASAEKIEFAREGSLVSAFARGNDASTGARLRASKTFSFSRAENACEIACDLTLSHAYSELVRLRVGLEMILNLLAPAEADRYFVSDGDRHPLDFFGELAAPVMSAVDEWQNVSAVLDAPGAGSFWIAPIETVSESEDGFERVYQGSQIMPVWSIELAPETPWSARLALRLSTAR
ncbi:MAG TPA: alpha-amylase/4-alpha-glucanotransferase domain-containing protein, partial [Candidatus Acidoferrales bacterium]|nr:alpha-amylase/4-alpha-glucanotransferase domain-containing protein [Candidatus Acidoferrales bacterium]